MPRSRLPQRPYRVSPLALEHDLPAVTDYHLGCGMLRLLEQGFPVSGRSTVTSGC